MHVHTDTVLWVLCTRSKFLQILRIRADFANINAMSLCSVLLYFRSGYLNCCIYVVLFVAVSSCFNSDEALMSILKY